MNLSLKTAAAAIALLVVGLMAQVALAGGHCDCCGGCGDCCTVCVLECYEKEIEVPCWRCECEPFCLPGPCQLGCKHCCEACCSGPIGGKGAKGAGCCQKGVGHGAGCCQKGAGHGAGCCQKGAGHGAGCCQKGGGHGAGCCQKGGGCGGGCCGGLLSACGKCIGWRDECPGCPTQHHRKILLRKIVKHKIPAYKWVVKSCCDKCEAKIEGAEVPEGADIPAPPPVEAAKYKYRIQSNTRQASAQTTGLARQLATIIAE